MRLVPLVLALSLALGACSASGGAELVLTSDPGEPASDEPAADEPVAESPPTGPEDFCVAWLDLHLVEEVLASTWERTFFGVLDEEVAEAWAWEHLDSVFSALVPVLPADLERLGPAVELLLALEPGDPARYDEDAQRELLADNGFDYDRIVELADRLVDEGEETCGDLDDLSHIEIELAELPVHVARVAEEIRLGAEEAACVTSPPVLVMIEDWFADPPVDPAAAVAGACDLDAVDSAMFVWRVGDIQTPVTAWDDIAELQIDPDSIVPPAEYLGPPEIEPDPAPEPTAEVAVPEPVEPDPTPEVFGYRVEGLVLDVLGTLVIVGDPVECMIEAGLYEPAELWLDTPGVDPQVLVRQRDFLDAVAIGCGFGAADVDQWLDLGHEYLGDVAG